MYSRYHDRSVRVPENYGGVAFSEATTAREVPPHRLEVAKPTPPPVSDAKEAPDLPHPRAIRVPSGEEEGEALSVLPSEASCETEMLSAASEKPSGGTAGGVLPFLHGMRFDDLLLLSLLLLLSQSGTESDVVLWLALLLFCG